MTDKTTYEITSVENQEETGQGQKWLIKTQRSDGAVYAFLRLHTTWAARAAEYGIDPLDIDTILDVCLHESFNDVGHTHPDFVYNASEEHARTALLARISAAKEEHLVTDPQNLLQMIKDHHQHTPHADFHKSHGEKVRTMRKSRVTS